MNQEEKIIRERAQRHIQNRSQVTNTLLQIMYFGGAMSMKYLRPSRSICQLMSDQEREDYYELLQRERLAVARLRKKKLVEIDNSGQELTARLTDEGLLTILQQSIVGTTKLLPDGKSCVVVYDVPVQFNTQRDRLRRFLKSAGFMQYQQSVWYTRKDVVDDLEKLLTMRYKYLKIQITVMKIL